MATTPAVLYRGAAATSSTTLYTTSTTTTIVTNIAVTNTAASPATFTITLDGTVLIPAASIAANSTAFFDVKQVLASGKIIAGFASATTVNFHISGVTLA